VAWSGWRWRTGKLFESKLILRAWMLMTPAGFIAVLAGWYTTEIGRQPYVIYGLMRTAQAASAVGTSSVITSLVAFGCVYLFVFTAGTWYLLKLLRKGPQVTDADLLPARDHHAGRPMSAATDVPEGR
jgi:cytochrome d ubiquinol oxidase subunit I